MKKQMIILLVTFTLMMIPTIAFASTKAAATQIDTVVPISSTQSSAIYVTDELNVSTADSNSIIPYSDRVNESHLSFALYAVLIVGSMFGLEKIKLMEE